MQVKAFHYGSNTFSCAFISKLAWLAVVCNIAQRVGEIHLDLKVVAVTKIALQLHLSYRPTCSFPGSAPFQPMYSHVLYLCGKFPGASTRQVSGALTRSLCHTGPPRSQRRPAGEGPACGPGLQGNAHDGGAAPAVQPRPTDHHVPHSRVQVVPDAPEAAH